MRATVWSDYLCPWCYLGRDRNALLRELGVELTHLPFDLHPEVPVEGTPVRPGGRLDRVLDRVAVECTETGLPFTKPERLPNTRRALEAAEVVRTRWAGRFAAFDDALFRGVFVDGADLADPAVLRARAADVGLPGDELEEALRDGAGASSVDASVAQARAAGVTATPAWLFETGLLVSGVQPRETLSRWVRRMLGVAGTT
jgi:predicted DsbA family dithiol-disulfide isomerase